MKVVEGKAQYPDMIRLRIPRDELVEFARDVLLLVDIFKDDDIDTPVILIGKYEKVEE